MAQIKSLIQRFMIIALSNGDGTTKSEWTK